MTSHHVDHRAHVEPGGASYVLDLAGVTMRKTSVSSMDNNCYLLTCASSGEQLLVDAADDADRLGALIDEGSGTLHTVVTTHQHWDHHRALADVVQRHRPRTAAGTDDAEALPVRPQVRLDHGDTLQVGSIRLDVVGLRGHTPGSVALALTDTQGRTHLLTGDSLFPGGPGKTPSDADFAQLMDDLESRVFAAYGDDTVVHPGHGDGTTLGAERPQLAQWRERGW